MASRTNKEKPDKQNYYNTNQTPHLNSKDKPLTISSFISVPSKKSIIIFAACLAIWLLTFFHLFPLHPETSHPTTKSTCDKSMSPFYIHTLPARFNSDLVSRCERLQINIPACPHVVNSGLGAALSSIGKSLYASHEFCSDLIFHARLLKHPCRVSEPESAELFFVPFYASLYTAFSFREANHSLRDALAVDLVDHLSTVPSFRRLGGRDHFIAVGRTAWDMIRSPDLSAADFGANKLLYLPELANVAMLTVERHPWEGANQYGVPYPSYFHPRSAREMAAWQEKVRSAKRTHLFAFVGGAHVVSEKAAVRAAIFTQCAAATARPNGCLLVKCDDDESDGAMGCYNPGKVLHTMMRAHFCLQPPGISFTRRSVFDAILAGCVPVFFSEHTAYTQYGWYVPSDDRAAEWSVQLGPEKWNGIEEELASVHEDAVERMREAVVALIPSVTYAHPDSGGWDVGFRDAVDVALAALTERTKEMQRQSDVSVE